MSTAQPIDSTTASADKAFVPVPPQSRGEAAPRNGRADDSVRERAEATLDQVAASLDEETNDASKQSADVDQQLIRQTTQQINRLVHEITQLSQSDCSLEEFYGGFLNRVVSALAAVGGAIWTVDQQGGLQLQYQINLAKARLTESKDRETRHALLLRKVLAADQATLMAPQSGAPDDDEAGNPTDFLLVLGTVKLDQQTHGIVEIFQRPGGGPVTQRGYLRFLTQMCALAGDFLKNRRLRDYGDRQALWDRLEDFIHAIHRSLDPRDTVYAIANEGRRLIECDRVSVAVCRGRRCDVEVVSGLDSIDRRTDEVKRLSELAQAVVRTAQPLWHAGDTEDLPPQIESALQVYLDKSPTKLLAVVPLTRPSNEGSSSKKRRAEPIGALIFEQFSDGRSLESLKKRVEVVAQHSSDALSNALDHNSLPLMPLWRALGRAKWFIEARHLPKTTVAMVAAGALAAALCIVPADSEMSATGNLQPSVRHEIFAPLDGVLIDVPVAPAQSVARGQVLAQLENNELEVEIAGLLGRRRETQEQALAVNRAMLDSPQQSSSDGDRLAGELSGLLESLAGIDRQLALYREKQQRLTITSPEPGQVVTWQVREKLLRRPVARGQRLMTVVDPNGPWELELHMPERRMCHVDAADRDSDEDLQVTFILATHPGQEFQGRVVQIDRTADVRGEEGNTVLIRVAIDKDKLPDLRAGSKVTARVHCGREPLGYVLFQDLIETVHTQILFWF